MDGIKCNYCGSEEITPHPEDGKEMCEHCGHIQSITVKPS